ncbi:ABC transporter F family member 3 [Aduncisulcus paluster]|uniref:ABC transporter F family member 3 n=1 Tax=Aduncisulcus paluster TaxID=2918883 RepID=A0ABQ5K4H0_9EUKA|nr:ABC transporter F family member 3 [Aduncisulcus paluster]|eukprot:gnl/Carplike_NY0171/2876_a3865_356.p1 GENE.gnl/Carplike_NY0171/2876_a3865_356~~gnl/Carplike_NY0171/2876_a3865_356.p1  ORF type:complete len:765 (+),score=235.98 gnl/Carplike_NY0171/2876_a3865_356:35-2296(+)
MSKDKVVGRIIEKSFEQFKDVHRYIIDYAKVVANNLDYSQSKDARNQFIQILSPILLSFGTFTKPSECETFFSDVFSKLALHKDKDVKKEDDSLEGPVSAQGLREKVEKRRDEWISRQKHASLEQRILEERIRQTEEQRLKNISKRIARGKSATLLSEQERRRQLQSIGIDAGEATVSAVPTAQEGMNIVLENFSVAFGGKELLTNTNLRLVYGRRYGFVGRNGMGKSTLLRYMNNRELPVSKELDIFYVSQEAPGDDRTVIETVLECDLERTRLVRMEKDLVKLEEEISSGSSISVDLKTLFPGKDGHSLIELSVDGDEIAPPTPDQLDRRMDELYNEMMEKDAFSAEAKASRILSGLQFTPAMQQKPTKEFSGGWRMRVSLATALYKDPDVLMLDEPSNHLDLSAVLWLEDYLKKFRKLLILVSHDIQLLDAVCTDIINIEARKLVMYSGNYSSFVRTRAAQMKTFRKMSENQAKRREHMQKFIDKFRFNAKRASMAQSRIKALQKMDKIDLVEEDASFQFSFPSPSSISGDLISLKDVAFSYTGTFTPSSFYLKDVNLTVRAGSRIALVGGNGEGKSTLLKLLFGQLTPQVGKVEMNERAKVSVFRQHHAELLPMAETPISILQSRFPGGEESDYRTHLGSFGVTGALAVQPIRTLSGGQKSRVAFALLTFANAPHILLLDEVSNHLDIATRQAIIHALIQYTGSFVLVSHDAHLIETTCDELWVVGDSTVKKFEGDFSAYRTHVMQSMK